MINPNNKNSAACTRELPREDKSAEGAKTAADRDHQRSADLVGGPAH